MFLSPISPLTTVAAALLLVVGGSTPVVSHRGGRAPVQAAAEDPNIRCAASRAASVAIPFERVDLRDAQPVVPRMDSTLIYGPRMFAVIEDSTTWPAVWSVAADSMKPFPVTFGTGVLVLAATTTYGTAPANLRITSIRRCSRTGVTVVSTTETRPSSAVPMAVMMRRRGIDLVRVPRTARLGVVLLDQRVRFEGRDR
jgi:hypothetical protein